jgi:hypothetical protein
MFRAETGPVLVNTGDSMTFVNSPWGQICPPHQTIGILSRASRRSHWKQDVQSEIK